MHVGQDVGRFGYKHFTSSNTAHAIRCEEICEGALPSLKKLIQEKIIPKLLIEANNEQLHAASGA